MQSAQMLCKVNARRDRMGTLLQQLTRGNAVLLIVILGIGGSFHSGYHLTDLSSPSPFIKRFINSSWHDRYEESPPPETITLIWSLIVSMYAVGGLLGSVCVTFVLRRLGRKKTVIGNGFIAIVASGIMLASKDAKSYEMIIVARILYGFSSGLGQTVHLLYLGEISPRNLRGIVTVTLQTFLSLGKLSGQFFGLSEILGREDLWNFVLCVPVVLSVIQIIAMPFFPEAPRYLFIEKGDEKACKKALQSLWGKGDYKEEMDEMLAEQAAIDAAPTKSVVQLLRDRTVRWQIIILSLIIFCLQMSGMSTISTFSYDIFQSAGIPADQIRYFTVGLGLAEIVISIFCGLVIDRIGRRLLFWGGYGIMCVCWVLVTVVLNFKDSGDWVPYFAMSLMIAFVFFHRGGPGGALGTVSSEIFIQSDRLAAFVLVGIERWLFYGVQGQVFPFLIKPLGLYCFVLFACVCLFGCLTTFFLLPETKGKTLLEIYDDFQSMTPCGKSSPENNIEDTKL